MSPFIRWRVIPETENTGRAKRTLNVLLWLPHLTKSDLAALDQVQILREYLLSMKPPICAINLLVPVSFVETAKTLTDFLVPIVPARESQTDQNILDVLGRASPDGMAEALSTALSCPADVLVVGDTGWFRYFREFEKFNVLIADTTVLLRQCEIFVRGHEIPWSFEYMVWNEPWTAFYVLSETTTFRDGLRYLDLAHKKGLDPGTQDTAMMLIHNRLPNLCLTRDRLLFYEMQQAAAKRAKWQRQDFAFEVGYFINFYYLLIYGGFDHLASIVNTGSKLGLQEKQVGATYESFLNALSQKAPEIHALFTDAPLVSLFKELAL